MGAGELALGSFGPPAKLEEPHTDAPEREYTPIAMEGEVRGSVKYRQPQHLDLVEALVGCAAERLDYNCACSFVSACRPQKRATMKSAARRISRTCLCAAAIGGLGLQSGCVPKPVAMIGTNVVESPSASANSQPSDLDASVEATANALRSRVESALDTALTARSLSTQENAAWQILHGVVCFGDQLTIDTPDRGEVPALEYAFSGGVIRGFELQPGDVHPKTNRRGVKAKLEPGSYVGQGHVDQWIAICAMCDLPPETVVQIGDQEFTVLDWARQAQYDVSENYLDEYGWTLIALTHYLPDEPSWIAKDGRAYSLEDLVQVEVDLDLATAACGGTHSLAGVVRALNLKKQSGLPDSAIWTQAQELVDQCIAKAKMFRASDGRLSCYYFDRSGVSVDLSAELSSAGHVFEFLALALQRDELSEAWVEGSLSRLCSLLESAEHVDLECGGLYHALNGLKIYHDRRWGND